MFLRRKQPLTVRVTGSHAVKHAPEYCHLILGIKLEDSTPQAVLSGLAESTAAVTDYLHWLSSPINDPMSASGATCEVDIRWTASPTASIDAGLSPAVLVMQDEAPAIVQTPNGYRGATTVLGTFRDLGCLDTVIAHLTVGLPPSLTAGGPECHS